jgi:hypothetical protein
VICLHSERHPLIVLANRQIARLTKEIKDLGFRTYGQAINYALKHLREEPEKEKQKT